MVSINNGSVRRMIHISSSLLFKIVRLVILLGLSYLMLHPVLTMVSLSLSPYEELYSSSRIWIPDNPTFTNFTNTLQYFEYWKHAWNSIQIAVISTLLQLVSCSLAAYGLARIRFRGNSVVFAMVIATIIVPIQTSQIPQFLGYQNFDFFGIGSLIGIFTGEPLSVNLLNTKWVYYLPAMFGVGLNSGLYIFIFRQFFKSLPQELEDAGRVDGCNAFLCYLRIVIPNTKPVFVTVILLSMVFYWNDSVISRMFLTATEAMPLMVRIGNIGEMQWVMGHYQDVDRGTVEAFAAILMVVVPLIIIFIICQKFFVECMDRSGIKG